jgi:hypothetical protein
METERVYAPIVWASGPPTKRDQRRELMIPVVDDLVQKLQHRSEDLEAYPGEGGAFLLKSYDGEDLKVVFTADNFAELLVKIESYYRDRLKDKKGNPRSFLEGEAVQWLEENGIDLDNYTGTSEGLIEASKLFGTFDLWVEDHLDPETNDTTWIEEYELY